MWNIIQCAVQGRSHIASKTPCQDKTFSYSQNGINVIALADGAGSEKLSHFGAETVTKFICCEMAEQFDEYYTQANAQYAARQLMSGIENTLDQKAKELECAVKELASTLLFAAVKDDRYILSHIGDGVIGYYKNGEVNIASQPNNGEYANTTVFTTSGNAMASMKMLKGTLGDIKGFVLMSDGSEASLYDKRKKVPAQALKKVMDMCTYIRLDKIQEHLQRDFENTIRYKTTDDCSIAILMNSDDEFKGYLSLNKKQKCRLLQIKGNSRDAVYNRYDDILSYLRTESGADELAKHIHLKPKYLKRNYLKKLCDLNFVERVGANYKTILIMDS
ncbi:MAG: protein phosphatase 2C domain-containing protein [Prevotella sp.]|nr:protein phosphatase 2C domain-containing protein [Prevotella sp.]